MTIAAGVEQRTREKEDKQDTSGSDVEGTQPEKTGSQSDESEGKEEDAADDGHQEWGAPLTQTDVVPQRLVFGNKSPKSQFLPGSTPVVQPATQQATSQVTAFTAVLLIFFI